jgi:hypothetical protein
VDLAAKAVVGQVPFVLRGSIGRVRPDVAGGVGLVDEVRRLGAVVAGGIGRSPFPDQTVGAVDADMVLVAKGGDRQIDALRAVLGRLAFEYLIVHRPSRSFWLALPVFPSSGMRPSLMSFFSASVLRCLGAATIVASVICAPIARKPAFVSDVSKRLNKTPIAGWPSIFVRVSSSRKFQVEFASGTLRASDNPRKSMNERRSLLRYSVRSSDSEWLDCRIST